MDSVLFCTGHEIKFPDIVKGSNCTLYDAGGNKYLDLESGVWCTSVGHCNPRITKLINDQSSRIIHTGYCYYNPIIEKTSKDILDITGIKTGKCVFLCSGSEAVEFSVKIVQDIYDKPYLLTMKDSYLSAFGSSGEKVNDRWLLFDWKNRDSTDSIPFEKISAFIFEPGSSSGLVHFPPTELIHEIIDKVRANNGIIIANEVTTGIGRTGKWFGYNHYNIIPDIVAIGKGLGNGYPVSCTVLSDNVVNKLDASKFHYSQSHQNDPLGAAIAHEVIEIIKDNNLLVKSKNNGDDIMKRLQGIKEKHGVIKDVRGRGLMIAIEFENNNNFSWADLINNELLKKNIILVKRPEFEIFRMDPALTIDDRDIDYFISSMESIIAKNPEQRHDKGRKINK
jgi:acetylornithine/N-succinyldiaminopimelate aminotransferase